MNSSKQIKLGALLSYISIGVNILSGLLYTPWMINQIGKSDYGLYTLANSLITLFLIDFGLSSATARYLSKYNAEGNRKKAEEFLGAVYKLYFIVDTVILAALVIIFFNIENIYVTLTPDELVKFKVVYVVSAIFSVTNFPFVTFNGILTSHEKFIHLKISEVIYRVMLVAFTIVALLMGFGVYALVTVHAFVGWFITLYKYVVIKRSIKLKVNFRHKEKSLFKEIFSFSIWTTISTLAQRLVFNITPSILGMVTNSAQIAIFGIVTTIEGYTYMLTTAINGMFMPRISRIMNKDGDGEENLSPLLIKVGRFQYAVNGLIIAGFAVVGKQFINLWMGPDYFDAYYGILLVVIPGIFFNSLQIANTTMVVTKRVNIMAAINIATGVSNVCLSYPFSKHFGVLGACVSICIAYMLRSIAVLVIYNKVLPVNIPEFIKKCYLRMSVPVILTIAAGFGINYIVADSGWIVFVIKAAAVVAFYAMFILLFGLYNSEKKAVLGMAKGIKRKIIGK